MQLKSVVSMMKSSTFRLFFVLSSIYFFLFQYARYTFYRDPTSYFFDPVRAYAPGYTAQRREEASSFTQNRALVSFKRLSNDTAPKLCIGIASVARQGDNYLQFSIGSLLDGLSFEERKEIVLLVSIAHTNPEKHPDYHSSWLHNTADEVLDYSSPFGRREYIQSLEGKSEHSKEKSVFDYSYLLEVCGNTEAQYVLMMEDDTIATKGWYGRTMKGLEFATRKTEEMGYNYQDFLYVRLFYAEKFLGWNSESNPRYFVLSLLPIVLLLTPLLIPFPRRPKIIPPASTIRLLSLVYAPLFISLFFLSGKPSMLPIRRGVNLMPKYACCTQALVFPAAQIPGLVTWLDRYRVDADKYQDQLIEMYADENEERRLRWALTPCEVQHIGDKSSKQGGSRSARERLWSFGFEKEGERL